jgi:hypothetical protein
MSKKKQRRLLQHKEHTPVSEAEHLKAAFAGGEVAAILPVSNRAARRRDAKKQRQP